MSEAGDGRGGGEGGGILARIRGSCAAAVDASPHVSVDEDAMREVLDGMDWDDFKSTSAALTKPPLAFDTLEDEINYWAVLNLLNFGSGYRHLLHESVDRGAYMTMTFGVLGMHINGVKFSADFLSSISLEAIKGYFEIKADEEVKIMPAVYETRKGPLYGLTTRIMNVLNETGDILKRLGCKDLATFILREYGVTMSSKPVGAAGAGDGEAESEAKTSAVPAADVPLVTAPSAERLVDRLVHTFPAFRDVATVGSETVYLCKKAQILAADMHRTFGEDNAALNYSDYGKLTVFTDNVVPAVLRKMGIVKVSDELAAIIDEKKVLPAGEMEAALRASAIVACEKMVAMSDGKISNDAELDYFLWTIGKRPEYRSFERHATQDTVYY